MSNAAKTFEVPSFESVAALRECVDGTVASDLYPRDGTERLSELEARFAELVGVQPHELLVCASGMAAVTGTINSLLKPESVLAYPHTAYKRTLGYAHWLRRAGHKTVQFDSGDPSDIERVVSGHRPDIILSETVGNGYNTPVLDTDSLTAACDAIDLEPTFVLDNTLPLSTGFSTDWLLDSDRKIVFVESATKAYAFNRELAGLVYSPDAEILDGVRTQRQTDGFGPNVAGVENLHRLLPTSSEFNERNARIFRNSSTLAHAAFRAQGDGRKFVVSHPDLPDHPNHALSQNTLLSGSSPVFFLTCISNIDQFQLAERLWQSPAVRAQADLGQSFGFNRARILPGGAEDYPVVRIAAGAETDPLALGCALKRALEEI